MKEWVPTHFFPVHGNCILDKRAFYIIASLHPWVKMGTCEGRSWSIVFETATVAPQQLRAVYSLGSWERLKIICSPYLLTCIEPSSDADAILWEDWQNVRALIRPGWRPYVCLEQFVLLLPNSLVVSHTFTVPSFEQVAKNMWSWLTWILWWKIV